MKLNVLVALIEENLIAAGTGITYRKTVENDDGTFTALYELSEDAACEAISITFFPTQKALKEQARNKRKRLESENNAEKMVPIWSLS